MCVYFRVYHIKKYIVITNSLDLYSRTQQCNSATNSWIQTKKYTYISEFTIQRFKKYVH